MCSANLFLNWVVKCEVMAILKFYRQNVLDEVKVLIQNFLFPCFLSQLLLKLNFFKCNMFNRYKNNVSKMFFSFFSNFKIVDLK